MHLDFIRNVSTAFPKIENKIEVRSIRIWYCKFNIQPIVELSNLEEVMIASFSEKTLEIFASLRKLRYLSILHMPKVSELEALAKLATIESLSLGTSPSWDAAGRCTFVQSLMPIACMAALKHLELFGVCSLDKSLAALESCKNLQSARFSQYPKDEVERFYRKTGVVNKFNPKPLFLA